MSIYSEQLEWIELQQSGEQQPSHDAMLDEPEVNIGKGERIASAVAAAALIGAGVYLAAIRRPIGSALMGIGGGLLLRRGMTGHCNVYEALGINRADGDSVRGGDDLRTRAINVEECITIGRSASDLYAFWRDLRNLPRIMRHLERVDVLDDRNSRWVAAGPGGRLFEWEAVITQERPDELIAWKTTGTPDVASRGSVRFRPASGDRGTVVEVILQYRPPGGRIGAGIAKLFGREPAQEIREDLKRFKAEMETGEIPTVEGQSRGTCAS
jgi:uncharacterized membrane protein